MRVGFVGLGTMGGAMAANAARAGFEVSAWNRTPGRAAELGDLGVHAPRQRRRGRGRERDRDHDRLRHAGCRGGDVRPDGVAEGAARRQPRRRHVDDLAVRDPRVRRRLAERRVGMLDAPGLRRQRGREEGHPLDLRRRRGGGPGAGAGRSSQSLGTTITHVGPIGAGQAVKAVNQVILAGTYLGVAEGIVLALKAGPRRGAGRRRRFPAARRSRWVLTNRSGRMLENDYPLGFKVALHRKDLGIALAMARELGRRCRQRAVRGDRGGLIGQGHADDDMSAVARSIRGLSGLES